MMLFCPFFVHDDKMSEYKVSHVSNSKIQKQIVIDFPTLTELTQLSESKFLSMEKTLHCYEGETTIEKS